MGFLYLRVTWRERERRERAGEKERIVQYLQLLLACEFARV